MPSAAQTRPSADATARERRSAWWMLLAAMAFAPMAACVKLASAHYGVAEVLAARGSVGVVVFAAMASIGGVTLRTAFPARHLQRGMIGAAAIGGWMYALSLLPLATAYMLYHTSSLWIALGVLLSAVASAWGSARTELAPAPRGRPATPPQAAPDWSMATVTTKSILRTKTLSPKERVALIFQRQWPLALVLVLGFSGVVLLLLPGLQAASNWGYAVGAGAGLIAAWAVSTVARLGRLGEPEVRIGFWFMLLTACVGLLLTLVVGVSQGFKAWSLPHASWLLLAACLATVGQWAMTKAFASGSPLLAANLQYAGVPLAAVIGMLAFGEQPGFTTWLGIAVVVGSAAAAAWIRSRQDRSLAHVAHQK